MKKILSVILALIAGCSLIFMGAENPDGSLNFWWSISWLAVLVISVKLWEKLNPEKEQED